MPLKHSFQMAQRYFTDSTVRNNGCSSDSMQLDSDPNRNKRTHVDPSKIIPHFQSQLMPLPEVAVRCDISPGLSPRRMVSISKDQENHYNLLQTTVTPVNRTKKPLDNRFRSLLPKLETFNRPVQPSPLQEVTVQPYASPGQQMTSDFGLASYPRNSTASYRIGPCPFPGHETISLWQSTPVASSERPTSTAPSQQAPLQLRPNRWQQARDYRRKVYEPPYIDPHTDHTLPHAEANAEVWVNELIKAMTNTEDVKDTVNSHHLRLFSSEAIDSLLIEACCREIFTALIDRCRHGFRGPAQFNKALRASHQLEPDRTATCEERIKNVVKVLSWNKRACKDVLYEDWKIRLLVNHPLSYDKEKDAQKGSNDQRRKRQLAEREKMERTEEELKAYRDAILLTHDERMDVEQPGKSSAYGVLENHVKSHESYNLGDFGTPLGKRTVFDTPDGTDRKRQCL